MNTRSNKMTPARQLHIRFLLFLLLLIFSCSIDTEAKHNSTVHCLPDQASSLLQLKRSFIDVDATLSSWLPGKDCCHWDGIACDMVYGTVISLDLGGFNMRGRRLDPALFNLTSLRNLNLAFNDFTNVHLSCGFERLKDIIHLNFSNTNFLGQIPIEIAHLKNLATLDFSCNNQLYLQEPNFQTFMANLSNLRELHLDEVDISSNGSSWSVVLADSLPQLQILSLQGCGISDSIHPSFSRLRSLTTVDIGGNFGLTGEVPEFFAEFSSLSILDISGSSFQGEFPAKIFKLKSLRTLDLSGNPDLSVCLPDFQVGNNLEALNLARITLSCDLPSSFTNLKSLKTLGISTIGISKKASFISKLPSLIELRLYGWGLEKLMLSWIGNLKQLTSLELVSYDFSQSVPSWIGNLTSLASLEIRNCNFLEPIPYQIGNLANLTRLGFESCNCTGHSIPSWIGNFTNLRELTLFSCNFSGPIPLTIGNLGQLKVMEIADNKLSGGIPKSLFALPSLQILYLNSNQLSGPLEDIPVPLSSHISTVRLEMNQLSGQIPKSFFQLKHLKYLNLGSNKLSSTVELSSFWKLKSLSSLVLSNNLLSIMDKEGDIASPSLPNINFLNLASCNLTKLPGALRYLDKVSSLDLSSNQIDGAIPSWVWKNWKDQLTSLNLSYNMFTTLENSLSLVHMPYLNVLDLSFNRLQGRIPIPVTSHIPFHGVVLDYSNNNFSSIVPNFGRYITNITYLNLSKNKLNGHLPSSICRASKLYIMDLSYNNFSGLVPSCLIESGKLSVLKLRENKFHGMLPKNIRKGCKIQTIDLNGNQIKGGLPRSLSNCQDLQVLDVGHNQIVGSFPSWLGILPRLRVLVLRSNQLNGTIKDTKGDHHTRNHFTSLQILCLASNNFSGNLPKGWFNELNAMMANANDEVQVIGRQTNSPNVFYQDTITITFKGFDISFTKILTTFKAVDISNNAFDGPIPELIGRLVSLHGIDMSHNKFTGQIPSQLSNLSQLESLDLSWNQLSGEIPQELISLTYLAWLNISYNNLTGRIPQGNQFLSFSNSSFEGNACLCGLPLSKQCGTPDSIASSTVSFPEPNSFWHDKLGVIMLFAFTGLGFGVGFLLAFMLQLLFRIEGWVCKH